MALPYDRMTRRFSLGTAVGKSPEPVFIMRYFGNILVSAKTRYGKSCIVRNIILDASEYRSNIVFDYKGEHSYKLLRQNWNADTPKALTGKVKIVRKFCFKLSQLRHASDWASLGFSSEGIRILPGLARLSKVHQDDPKAFISMLAELPDRDDKIEPWNLHYGKVAPIYRKLMHNAVDSIVNKFQTIMHWFWQGHHDLRPTWDWRKLFLENDHVIIDLDVRSNLEVLRARLSVGIILRELQPILHIVKPCITVEEAGVVAPNISGEHSPDKYPSSLQLLEDYSARFQKFGVMMIYICQHPDQLSPTLFRAGLHFTVLGMLDGSTRGYYHKFLDKVRLMWNPDAKDGGYRECLLINQNGTWSKFTPAIAYCSP